MIDELWRAAAHWVDERAWAQLLIRAAMAAVIAWIFFRAMGLIGLVVALAPAALLTTVPLTHSGFDLLRWLRKSPVRPWNGRWYEFERIQVRIFEHPDHTWFCADDVFRALGEPVDKVVHERFRNRFGALGYREPAGEDLVCFSEAALRRYLATRRDEHSLRFSRWIERDVLFAHEKRRREAPFR
ncbi:hypothetical protein GCM10025771_22790 [Niveibacterium umoris]|uniref:Uncharacterized protein n=1 Tax=Niveibacterium umoris TaxID=1193620 RepID=A0A840BLL2_9RHOO|nr:hypothetical protein [Niveibacterium umoris]MBB4012532.1 hypothetical protein [Niveibacterium umoris]